jgi:hypothetical protein
MDRHSRLPPITGVSAGNELVADELDPWYGEWVGSQWRSEIPARRPLTRRNW